MTPALRRPSRRRDLLLSTIVLLALAVSGIVGLASAHATWALVLAVIVLGAATAAMLLAVRALLLDEIGAPAPRSRAGTPVVVGATCAIALAVAVAVPRLDDVLSGTQAPDAAAAAQTFRDFLSSALVDGNAYAGCQYLTPSEQQRIALIARAGPTCRDAFTATPPALDRVTSDAGVRRLHLTTDVRGSTAGITVAVAGSAPLVFQLQRTTAAEADAFDAPTSGWRISGGAQALL